MDEKNVFISYKSEEIFEAQCLKELLEKNGISVWMAPMCIVGGSSYAVEIPRAIRGCKVFVLVLSERAQASKWVSREVDMAINEGKVIMPFMLENCALKDDFSFYLTNVQRYTAYENRIAAAEKMIREIKTILGMQDTGFIQPEDTQRPAGSGGTAGGSAPGMTAEPFTSQPNTPYTASQPQYHTPTGQGSAAAPNANPNPGTANGIGIGNGQAQSGGFTGSAGNGQTGGTFTPPQGGTYTYTVAGNYTQVYSNKFSNQKTDSASVVSAILGIISLFTIGILVVTEIIAIVLAITGSGNIARKNLKGRGLALTGLITGLLSGTIIVAAGTAGVGIVPMIVVWIVCFILYSNQAKKGKQEFFRQMSMGGNTNFYGKMR